MVKAAQSGCVVIRDGAARTDNPIGAKAETAEWVLPNTVASATFPERRNRRGHGHRIATRGRLCSLWFKSMPRAGFIMIFASR